MLRTGTSAPKRVYVLDAWHDLECVLETSAPELTVRTEGYTVLLVEVA